MTSSVLTGQSQTRTLCQGGTWKISTMCKASCTVQYILKERFEGAANDDRVMFYCERCDYAGKSEAGLKVHTGKKHKGSP